MNAPSLSTTFTDSAKMNMIVLSNDVAKNKEYLAKLMPDSSTIRAVHDSHRARARASSNSPVQDLIVELMAQVDKDGVGLSYRKIAGIVRERVVGAETTAGSVACYRTYARKGQYGITPEQADAILRITRRR